jgi:hypothetical protein
MIRPKQSNVTEITFLNFKDTVMASDKPVVIKFTTSSCHLCKAFKIIFDNIADEYSDKFNFGNVNTVTQHNLTKFFVIDGVPEVYIVNPKEEDAAKRAHLLKYPEKPDERTGFSESYFKKQLDKYIDEKM